MSLTKDAMLLLGRSVSCAALFVVFCLTAAVAAEGESAISAFVNKTPLVQAGGSATFEVGITPGETATWTASSVAVTIQVRAQNAEAPALVSAAAHPPADIAAGSTVAVFVALKLAGLAPGTYSARAVVTHDDKQVAVSQDAPLVVGALAALAPLAKKAPATALHGNIGDNNTYAAKSSRSGDFGMTAKLPNNESLTAKTVLSNVPSAPKPLVQFQTSTTLSQFGTYSPAFDNGVFAGITGTGFTIRKQWGELHSLQFATISGGHATTNPFNINALSYALPIGTGTFTTTMGWATQYGPVDTTLPAFFQQGRFYGVDYLRPTNDAGFTYELRYGVIDYLDGISGLRRADRAMEAKTGFRFLNFDWTVDFLRAGPYYPTLTATGIVPDREQEEIDLARTLGRLNATFKFQGSRTGLNGSPATQNAHVWNEGVTLQYQVKPNESLQVDLSNAVNHVFADTPTNSLSQNLAFTYIGQRGPTQFKVNVGTATTQDNSGTTSHAITDSVSVTQRLGRRFSVTSGLNFNDNLGSAPSGTNLGTGFNLVGNYALGMFAISGGVQRQWNHPYAGTASPATFGKTLGLGYKSKNSPYAIQGSVTNTNGRASTTTGKLNLSRRF